MFSRNSRLFFLFLVVAAIAGCIWFFSPSATRPPSDPGKPAAARGTTGHPPSAPSKAPAPSSDAATAPAASPSKTTAPLTVDAILTNQSLDNVEAARALGTLVQDPALGIEARSEALAHMLNLSIDNETALLLPLLKSRDLPDSLATSILDEALNRPLVWQADACLAVISRPAGKELQAQARDHLGFLTGEDHSEDVDAWTAAVRRTRAKWEKDGQ